MARAMPRLRRGVDDISLTGDEERYVADQEFILSLEHEPGFRTGQMKMALVTRLCRLLSFGIAPQNIDNAHVDVAAVMSVADKLGRVLFCQRFSSDDLVVVD